MKKLYKAYLYHFGVFWTVSFLTMMTVSAQTYVNISWSHVIGLPDPNVNWSASALDESGNLIVVGNTQNTTEGINVLLTKYDPEGLIIWQEEYNHNGTVDDYGSGISIDGDGNIFIAGATFSGSNSTADYLMLKYDSDGQLQWDEIYNGQSDEDDLAADIGFDSNGNIYITGSSKDNGSGYDIVTLKLNDEGALQWEERYDRNDYDDGAVKIEVDQNGTSTIIGGSGESSNDWDYVTLEYDDDGNLGEEEIVLNQGFGFDQPADMVQDSDGNIYITGTSSSDSINYNILTVKLDSNFQVAWQKEFDPGGLNDGGLSIDVDGSGNIYVAGFATYADGQRFVALKYKADGSLIWDKYLHNSAGQSGIAKQLAVDGDGNIIVSGETFTTTSSEIITMNYSPDGDIRWMKTFEHTNTPGEHPLHLNLDAYGNIFVTGITVDLANQRYITLQYSLHERTPEYVLDSLNEPTHVKNEIIVSFRPSSLFESPFESTEIEWGAVSELIKPSVETLMEGKLGESDISDWIVTRVMRRMTIADSISTTRTGDQVKIQPYWASLILQIPNSIPTESGVNEKELADSLNTLAGEIRHTVINSIGTLSAGANDTHYANDMASLHPTTSYPSAHINIEGAWDIQTGKKHVKIGVNDSGIFWNHEDFGGSGGPNGSFSSSIIAGGWDYVKHSTITSMAQNDKANHGTKAAGIIGAIRNNNKGIAGIAGGDASLSIQGVQLYNMKISDDIQRTIEMADAIEAIVEGSIQTGSSGFGLHIMNHSYGFKKSDDDLSDLSLLQDAIYDSWRNGVINIAARGNKGNDKPEYPATFNDDWIISVSGTGWDGFFQKSSNGGKSSYGLDVDVAAPGVNEVIKTTDWGNNYTSFNGTSSSTPHVSGIAALLLSEANNPSGSSSGNLSTEDIEFLLQEYATDKVDPDSNKYGGTGYDDFTGWGLVNATTTMAEMEKPEYEVLHFEATSDTSHITKIIDNGPLILFSGYLSTLPNGPYTADVYEVKLTNSHNIPSGATILNEWPRNNASDLIGLAGVPEHYIRITQIDSSQATLVGYTYFIRKNAINWQNVNKWIPYDPYSKSSQFAYSVHIQKAITINLEDQINELSAVIIPNPSNGEFMVSVNMNNPTELWVDVFDLTGKKVLTTSKLQMSIGKNEIPINLRNYPIGMYFCRVQTNDQIILLKAISQ